jgi:hypothetical protein
MNETRETGADRQWGGVPEEDAVRRLIEEAGPRPALPRDDLAAIETAARAEWGRRYADRRASSRHGLLWLGLAAAALVGAIGVAWWAKRPGRTDSGGALTPVATVEVLTGVVRMRAADGADAVSLSSDSLRRSLAAGTELETSDRAGEAGRVALRMAGGASVRLDAGTRAKLVSEKLVALERGAVYVDSGSKPGQSDVAVRTAAGLFEELGTQFEVRVEDRGEGTVTRLRVREGRVALGREDGPVIAGAGQELVVGADGQVVAQPVAGSGPDWEWVLRAAPMLEIEGLKVREFLDWISRETGWRIELADREAASLADSVVLHGSIRHLTLAESPTVVLSSSGLEHRISGGTMIVFVAREDRR